MLQQGRKSVRGTDPKQELLTKGHKDKRADKRLQTLPTPPYKWLRRSRHPSAFNLMQVVSKANAFRKHLGEGRTPGLRLQRPRFWLQTPLATLELLVLFGELLFLSVPWLQSSLSFQWSVPSSIFPLCSLCSACNFAEDEVFGDACRALKLKLLHYQHVDMQQYYTAWWPQLSVIWCTLGNLEIRFFNEGLVKNRFCFICFLILC